MNLYAEKALARARGQRRSTLIPKARVSAAPVTITRAVTELPPRIDRVLYLEGSRAAKELLASMVGVLDSRESAASVLKRLRRVAATNPHSYAAGVLDVVAQVERALSPAKAPTNKECNHAR